MTYYRNPDDSPGNFRQPTIEKCQEHIDWWASQGVTKVSDFDTLAEGGFALGAMTATERKLEKIRWKEAKHYLDRYQKQTGLYDEDSYIYRKPLLSEPVSGSEDYGDFDPVSSDAARRYLYNFFVRQAERVAAGEDMQEIDTYPFKPRYDESVTLLGQEESDSLEDAVFARADIDLERRNPYRRNFLMGSSMGWCPHCKRSQKGGWQTFPTTCGSPSSTKGEFDPELKCDWASTGKCDVTGLGGYSEDEGLDRYGYPLQRNPGLDYRQSKQQWAIELYKEIGNAAEVARRVGASPASVRRWTSHLRADHQRSASHPFRQQAIELYKEIGNASEVARKLLQEGVRISPALVRRWTKHLRRQPRFVKGRKPRRIKPRKRRRRTKRRSSRKRRKTKRRSSRKRRRRTKRRRRR